MTAGWAFFFGCLFGCSVGATVVWLITERLIHNARKLARLRGHPETCWAVIADELLRGDAEGAQ